MILKTLTRRSFLVNAAGATVGTWFSFGWLSGNGLKFSVPAAFAAETKSLSPAEAMTLQRLARTLYPHDRLDEKYYQAVVTGIDGEMAASSSLAAEIKEGLARLNPGAARANQATQPPGGQFADQSEEARTTAVKAMEDTPFFDTVKGKVPGYLYNNPEVWPLFGYEGSSWEKGGYLTRGFDDVNWL